jgi:hypothetical protein
MIISIVLVYPLFVNISLIKYIKTSMIRFIVVRDGKYSIKILVPY